MDADGRLYGSCVAKARIDAVLAERGLFPSRSAAAGAVRAGEVRVGEDGPVALRPSQLGDPEADFRLDQGPRFVSRGGIKLDNALAALGIEVTDRDCLDVGASTGGFSDCLLQRGAARVVALDVAGGCPWVIRAATRSLIGASLAPLSRAATTDAVALATSAARDAGWRLVAT